MRTSPLSYNGMAVSPCTAWCCADARASTTHAHLWSPWSAIIAQRRLTRASEGLPCLRRPAYRVPAAVEEECEALDYCSMTAGKRPCVLLPWCLGSMLVRDPIIA